MTRRRAVIEAIYRQVDAPDWAAPNLDGLADVLRDLSWLPEGEVTLAIDAVHQLDHDDARALFAVLHHAVRETAVTARPIRLA